MKLIKHLTQSISLLILLQIANPAYANNTTLQISKSHSLKNAYDNRYTDPKLCVSTIEHFVNQQDILNVTIANTYPLSEENKAIKLLAFCHSQLNQYQKTLQLLLPFLEKKTLLSNKARAITLLAMTIPEDERGNITNKGLIQLAKAQLTSIKNAELPEKEDLTIDLLFAITRLSLKENNFKGAGYSMSLIKKALEKKQNSYFNTQLYFYSGIYYLKINQHQLAISNLLFADKLANENNYIDISTKVKITISEFYQGQHRFKAALKFSTENVDLQMTTKNPIKQAETLINLAILKRQNKEYNTGTIYLFNALELIQNEGDVHLLANLFLELGQNYALNYQSSPTSTKLKLAQKYLQNARSNFAKINQKKLEIESLLLLAKLNIENKEIALAILQLESVLRIASEKHPRLKVQAFEMLALSYELAGDPQRAIIHFKNFHRLQNAIKSQLFRLQQSQITEQLQLFEETQKHKGLEVENNKLKQINKNVSDSVQFFKLIAAFSAILILYLLYKSHRLTLSDKKLRTKLSFHGRSSLPTQYSVHNHFATLYKGKPLFYALVYVPYLSQLNLTTGLLKGKKIEQRMGKLLLEYFKEKASMYHIRDSQILFVSDQALHRNSEEFALKIEQFFILFGEKYRLPKKVAIGMTAYPFLIHAEKTVSPNRTVNIASLALYGATQLQTKLDQTSWVELCAMDKLSPAFVDGNLWSIAQQGICKGVIKIKSNQPQHSIEWPEITTECNKEDRIIAQKTE